MRYVCLASDYDGTLAAEGVVAPETVRALERLVGSGRQLILVTGRILAELQGVFPRLDLCSLVVAENGAVLYSPSSGEERLLAAPAPDELILALHHRGVTPLDVGRVMMSTLQPHDVSVRDEVERRGLDLQLIYNKGSVMVLPRGVNKATGLAAALSSLGVDAGQAVGIGDAENDHSLLRLCGFATAVATCVPSLRDDADLVVPGGPGAGVVELVDMLLADDLASREHLIRHRPGQGLSSRLPVESAPDPVER
jgi:hydroxymethylpyrimidine pyrophosphatase-like HAD family hydrolase